MEKQNRISRTANVLKDKGFVEFQDNPNHQRSKLAVLNKKGRNVLDQVTEMQIEWSNVITLFALAALIYLN